MLLLGLLGILSVHASPPPKDLILLIDTSGSVRRANLVPKIQESVKQVLHSHSSEGDRVRIYTFDKDVRGVIDETIRSPEDRERISNSLGHLEAYGKWTHLASALERGLQDASDVRRDQPGRKVQIILYTDGRNDPPPSAKGGRSVTFDDLLKRYFQDKAMREDWFIFYVQMNEPDPALEKLIETTQSGRVVKPEEFMKGADFSLPSVPLWVPFKVLPLIALILFFIWLIFWYHRWHPWFRSVLIVPSNGDESRAVNLSGIPKPFLRYSVRIRLGDREILVGVDVLGRYLFKPRRGETLWLRGSERKGCQSIVLGESFRVGSNEYSLAPSQLKGLGPGTQE